MANENEAVLDDSAFYAEYAKKIKKEQEDKASHTGGSGFNYEEIGYAGLETGVNKLLRIVGMPIGADKMGYKRKNYDPKEIIMVECKGDDGKRFTFKMNVPGEVESDDNVVQRIYRLVMKKTYINGEAFFENKAKYPDLFEYVSKGGFKQTDGKTYSYSSGFK